MKYLQVVNWDDFQHYRDRNPPWIKLHNQILENYLYTRLPDAAKAHLLGLWMLASRTDNQIPADPKWIANKLSSTTKVDLNTLIDAGFLEYCNASNALADRSGDCTVTVPLEEKRRGETEKRQSREEESGSASLTPKTKDLNFDSWPEKPSDQVWQDWKQHRTKKKAAVNQTVINRMGPELQKALQAGFPVDDCLSVQIEAGWQGFKCEWLLNRENGNGGSQERQAEVKQDFLSKATDRSWANS